MPLPLPPPLPLPWLPPSSPARRGCTCYGSGHTASGAPLRPQGLPAWPSAPCPLPPASVPLGMPGQSPHGAPCGCGASRLPCPRRSLRPPQPAARMRVRRCSRRRHAQPGRAAWMSCQKCSRPRRPSRCCRTSTICPPFLWLLRCRSCPLFRSDLRPLPCLRSCPCRPPLTATPHSHSLCPSHSSKLAFSCPPCVSPAAYLSRGQVVRVRRWGLMLLQLALLLLPGACRRPRWLCPRACSTTT